jgi:gp32 DNA binding protein like
MPVNVQKLAARLKEFEDGQKASEFAKLLWKPKEGLQTVRIVPYKFNPDSPFIELKFYYNLGGNHYLAPSTFGKPDPILEVIETLRSSGSNEEKEIATKLNPTARTYAPIIVRGEEELGVRYWGFGVTVYKQLLKLMTNSKWGDITSWTEGNDIDVEFHKESKKKNAKGQSFPETTITPCPQKTSVVDPTRRDLMEKMKEQTDILQIFPLKTYEELQSAVNAWLYPSDGTDTAVDSADPASESATATPAAATAPITPKGSAPAADKLDSEFEKFFNS